MGKEAEFFEACRDGNVIKVEHLLATKNKKSIVPFKFSKNFSSLLQWKDVHGSSPLHCASLNGRKAVVYLLLDEGASVFATDANGYLPLHFAAWNGHFDVAAALISHDPRQDTVNARTKNNETPLHFSAQYGHGNIVTLLLRNGALIDPRNDKGETPLDLASKFGRLEVIRTMLDSNPHVVMNAMIADPLSGAADAPPPFSPLHLAAKHGKTEVVRTLLDAGFDINFFTEEGTALHVAALFGKIDVVKLLLENGVKADARDFSGRTVIELLESHQSVKENVLTQFLQNRDVWQHCVSLVNDHMERSSLGSSVSKEVANIYLNALQNHSPSVIAEPTIRHENAVWLPIPSNSARRMDFEQGLDVRSTGTPLQPLSVVTNFPYSPDSNSISSTISLTGTPNSTCSNSTMQSQLSPRFPLDDLQSTKSRFTPVFDIDTSPKSRQENMKKVESARSNGCTYQPVPMQYDNVPAPSMYPATTYDNVPTNATGYDNAPPPGLHAWTHECCGSDPKTHPHPHPHPCPCPYPNPSLKSEPKTNLTQQQTSKMELAKLASFPIEKTDEKMPATCGSDPITHLDPYPHPYPNPTPKIEPKTNFMQQQPAKPASFPTQKTDEKMPVKDNVAAPILNRVVSDRVASPKQPLAVKFLDAPPETLYLPVEARLYTRMDQPFSTVQTAAPEQQVQEKPVPVSASGGPYDNIPYSSHAHPAHQVDTTERALPADNVIESTIQLIAQSSRSIEESVEASVRSPSRASQRPVTPSTPSKIALKPAPPPVSPKPKMENSSSAVRAPLAQPEADELCASTDSMNLQKATVRPYATVQKTRKSASDSPPPSAMEADMKIFRGLRPVSSVGGSSQDMNSASSRRAHARRHLCVADGEAQADSGTASDCGSQCTCSGGSQCSLINTAEDENRSEHHCARHTGTERSVSSLIESANCEDAVSPIDEQAEWSKIEDIFKSCGTRIARLSVFDREIEPAFSNYIKGNAYMANGSKQNMLPRIIERPGNSVEQWLKSIGLPDYGGLFLQNGFDRLEFLNVTIDQATLRHMGITIVCDMEKILNHLPNLPPPNISPASSFRYVSDWLHAYGCQDYLGHLVKHGYDSISSVLRLNEVDFFTVFGENILLGHRLRLSWSILSSNPPPKTPTFSSMEEKLKERNIGSFSNPSTPVKKVSHVFDEGTVIYSAHYLGSALVEDVQGVDSSRLAMIKLKKATKEIAKVPQVVLEISYTGVRFFDSTTQKALCEHAVQNIHCVCQDERDMNCFAYITKDGQRHFCHVFSVLTADVATELILALGKAFDVAYRKVLENNMTL